MRSYALAEARADARAADAAIKAHRATCPACVGQDGRRRPCTELREMTADLATLRRDIRTWFDPGSDQETLI